ncbi:inositol monophosphatase family protein, partial [Kribbia dieselivorans]|uniref:inositol monophosphatase family protein n=1 Tax=Kribbia dieselivorans TaxID=331526 RepID=UPI000A483A89
LARRWWAAAGSGAWTGRSLAQARAIKVSGVTEIANASISSSSIDEWRTAGRARGYLQMTSDAWRDRAYGDFWSYMLVAEGAVDVAAEPELEVYDMAALVPIVREAGGRFTSLDGVEGPWGGNGVATNGRLHDEVLTRLAPDA